MRVAGRREPGGQVRRPRASGSSPPAATTRSRSRSAARSRPSRWASSRSRCSVRIFAEDYLPGRARVYSPTYTLLRAQRRAARDLAHRAAQQVAPPVARSARPRDAAATRPTSNCGHSPAEELDQPETRRKIENQAAAERTNGRRLSGLVVAGEDLVQQAMRNPEFGVGHLEKWAEMLQILKDIAGNRMPSVADLLKQAAQAPTSRRQPAEQQDADGRAGPRHAERDRQSSEAGRRQEAAVGRPAGRRSGIVAAAARQERRASSRPQAAGKPPRLTLPVTTLAGKAGARTSRAAARPSRRSTRPSTKQQDLLAEFEKIADELNRVLANLEGSTLVKRLKAASRLQYKIGGRIDDQVGDAFGVDRRPVDAGAVEGPRRAGRAGGQGEPGRLADHGRHAVVLRAPAVRAVQDRARRDAEARRGRQPAAARRRPEEGERRCRSPSANSGPTRSTAGPRTWSTPRRAARARAPSRGAACRRRSCWKCCRSSKAKSTSARRPAWPSRPGPRSTADEHGKQAGKLSETQNGLRDRVDKVGRPDPRAARRRERVRLRDRPAGQGRRR